MLGYSPTPAGSPHHCPLCRHELEPDPPPLYGDVTCPHCGEPLWYLWRGGDVVYYDQLDAERVRARVKEIIAATLGVVPERVPDDFREISKSLGSDSLDLVEVVMELEEELDP